MSCSQYVTFSFLLVVVSLLILIPFSYFMLAILIKQPKGGEYCFLNAYLILYSYFLCAAVVWRISAPQNTPELKVLFFKSKIMFLEIRFFFAVKYKVFLLWCFFFRCWNHILNSRIMPWLKSTWGKGQLGKHCKRNVQKWKSEIKSCEYVLEFLLRIRRNWSKKLSHNDVFKLLWL